MHPPNVELLLARLRPEDQVLDVGGWACPLNRAQWVIDGEPWSTRGFYSQIGMPAYQGPADEWFSERTWVQRDICAREPWPFTDKQFDFVVCSHVLEDLRDPLWVCQELIRVGKRGYIEVPSRAWESTLGIEAPGMAGLSHHRWLVDIEGQRVTFLPKYHLIHTHWRFSLPASYGARLSGAAAVQWLWWDDTFQVEERTIHGCEHIQAELERFSRSVMPRPAWQYALDRGMRRLREPVRRVAGALARRLRARDQKS